MPLIEKHELDLQDGIDTLSAKRPTIEKFWKYYHDEQPRVWLNPKMAEIFENFNDRFSLNLCKLAILTPLNRLWVESWDEEQYRDLWMRLRLDREQKRIYKHAMVAGESYVIGWRDARGNVQAGFNDPKTVHLFYRIDEPGVKDYAVKLWEEKEGAIRANLYYEDRIVRMIDTTTRNRPRKRFYESGDLAHKTRAAAFEYDSVDPGGTHQMGEVPVWRFATDLWEPQSRLHELTNIQDTINKLRSNKMVASETGAFPQRVYLTRQEIDTAHLVAEPQTALRLDPGDAEAKSDVKEFEATPLKNYDDAISAEVQNFFTVAHLPRHLLISPGADSSGDAIRADEGPFQELVRDIATNLGYTWTDMMHALVGQPDLWDSPDWQDARINNSESQAREFKTLVEGGMPPYFAAMKAFQWGEDDAEAAKLAKTIEEVNNLSDRSSSSTRTQTTEDGPQ